MCLSLNGIDYLYNSRRLLTRILEFYRSGRDLNSQERIISNQFLILIADLWKPSGSHPP